MGRWIVTGGAGFIGSNFAHYVLRTRPHDVLVLDKLTYAGRLENLGDLDADPRLGFVRTDIADGERVAAILREFRPDAIINIAAETHVDRSIDGPRSFIETNERGTFELLEASRTFWATLAAPERARFRFLQVSTDEVYGSLGRDGAFEETSPYAPNSPYAASKAAADHWVRAYRQTFGLPTLTTHCTNNYGPRQFPEKLIPLMILNALAGAPLPIYGDGRHVREWIHVEDHCSGIAQVLERGRVGDVYHVGGGTACSNLELVETLCDIIEELAPARANPAASERGIETYRSLIQFVPDRPGHDLRYAVRGEKIRLELGWCPAHDLRTGLRETVRWYLENRTWCEELGYRRERLGRTAAAAGDS